MNINVGDLVILRRGVPTRRGMGNMRGIVYDISGGFVHVMWANGRRTGRLSASLEVISGP